MKSLIIVESPTKARTIKKILGAGTRVISSKGHIKDLPKSRLGVEIKDHEFIPEYIKIRGKAKDIKAIRDEAKKADAVFLAPDPDREGEAIAQHLAEEIAQENVSRIRFYEITKEGIKKALAEPGQIDELLVDAHKARRVLDRLVGYKVSPLLWQMIRRGLSAGRVQSVALRILSEREAEIEAFRPEPYWVVKGLFEAKGTQFEAELVKIAGSRVERVDEKQMKAAKEILKRGLELAVSHYVRDEKHFPPPAPFKTSTLQQEASTVLHLAPRRTMRIAQGLYEGVTLGETTVGLISYMRTDSLRIAQEFISLTKGFISETMGIEWSQPRVYKDKKTAQAAHEAIRPTGLARSPEAIGSYLERDARRLYDLIYRRYLASQMTDARYESTVVELEHSGYVFRVRTLRRLFEGYERVYSHQDRETKFSLPDLSLDDRAKLIKLNVERKETQPPPRYTEASLVRKLDAYGIGRPSTYASIIGTLVERHYAIRERSTLIPTELGRLVNDILVPRFTELFNVKFTSRMEEELDQIADGKLDWQQALRDFWGPFSQVLAKVEAEIPEIKQDVVKETGEACPKCGKPLIEKWGRFGKFLACSGFPECRYTRPLKENEPVKVDKKCPECDAEMVVKVGRFGRFLACSRYPECKTTMPFVITQPCPLCGSEVYELRGKRGKFYKCSNDDCTFMSRYPLSDEKCEKCGKHKVADPRGAYCPVCEPRNNKKKKDG
ncbi:type I DNA topoisomerase [candidate division WOR-3 bacterium]|nr:type I DNA topoisomerase [candidate division WOR-3 bacterium]